MKNRAIKILLVISAVILLAAGCNKTQPKPVSQPVSRSANQPTQQTATQTSPSNNQATPTANHPVPKIPPITSVTVTQIVDGSKLNKPADIFVAGETAFQLLEKDHAVIAKNYTGIGEMVLSIDGVKPDSQHYWEFFVNGKSSNVGASSYVLKAGDKIEWKLSAISSSGE
jgi:hypothetical protein